MGVPKLRGQGPLRVVRRPIRGYEEANEALAILGWPGSGSFGTY